MFGATLKSYYAEKIGVDPKKMYVVSVMPCTAKKFEAGRPEISVNGIPDVDAVLTTRELAVMIKEAGIDFTDLPDEDFDAPMGIGSGAATIFGATGGVMEAALRTVVEVLSGKSESNVEYAVVRGTEGLKEAVVTAGDVTVKAAVVSGLANAKAMMKRIEAGEADYHFVEIMACPGGCVNGGGQPIQQSRIRSWIDLRSERAKGLYAEDRDLPVRKSHENETVKTLYTEFFGTPCGHKSHEILHTHYTKRDRF
jgi:NADP-reducing hydrogenase subunit HndD